MNKEGDDRKNKAEQKKTEITINKDIITII